MNAKQKLHQTNLATWIARFKDQAESGLTIKAWCQENNVSFHAYNYWKHLAKESYVDSMMPDIVPLAWVKTSTQKLPAGSATAKALQYSINQEPFLRVFLDYPDVPMDNNRAEQAIRPFTVSRKNWVVMNSTNGAQASAIIYSIVETARANNISVQPYLEYLFTELANHADDTSRDFIAELLPWSKTVRNKCRIKKP